MKVTDITTNVKFPKFSIHGDNGKAATITDHGNSWLLKYPNGMIKHFPEYHKATEYLTQRGY